MPKCENCRRMFYVNSINAMCEKAIGVYINPNDEACQSFEQTHEAYGCRHNLTANSYSRFRTKVCREVVCPLYEERMN